MEPVEVPSPTSSPSLRKGSYCTHTVMGAAEGWKSLGRSPVTAQLHQHCQLSLLSLLGSPHAAPVGFGVASEQAGRMWSLGLGGWCVEPELCTELTL